MEREEEGAEALVVQVSNQGWDVHCICLMSGREKDGVVFRSWAACPGRSASRKLEVRVEEER